jgi:hypothetical protein
MAAVFRIKNDFTKDEDDSRITSFGVTGLAADLFTVKKEVVEESSVTSYIVGTICTGATTIYKGAVTVAPCVVTTSSIVVTVAADATVRAVAPVIPTTLQVLGYLTKSVGEGITNGLQYLAVQAQEGISTLIVPAPQKKN